METPHAITTESEFDIAIVGMAGRFPGAANVDEFWINLCDGKESIKFFSDEELRSSGVEEHSFNQPGYVKAAPVLDDPTGFDPRFFGYTPNEAVLMDPQHRLSLELAWEAMENAGYDTARLECRVGVFASCAMNTYLLSSGILPKFVDNYLPTLIGSDKDFLATRISYRLGLTGPSMTIQTACSSSLVATHVACQSLLNQECDMALTGGAAIRVPLAAGHLYQEGSVFTPDGHCRPFDAGANGTIFGSGGGMVVLKRATDAIADGDNIVAVIKGSAVNNDGNSKAEYTAPSISSQSEVIIEALANAGVDADQMAYIETHGTGTFLGDPIEIEALSKAFRQSTEAKGYCAIGSVKSNIGHLDAAAGVVALIKTAMAVRNKRIPASINFERPNPQIDFANSPFFVNDKTSSWLDGESPQFAGVTSLGIGGTNAHVVLGAAPKIVSNYSAEPWQLLPLAARTESALDQQANNLADHLGDRLDDTRQQLDLADVAFTLQTGRRPFKFRQITIAESIDEAPQALLSSEPESSRRGVVDGERRDVVMMFSGQGSQYPGMAKGLYDRFSSFRADIDHCAEILEKQLDRDIRALLFGSNSGSGNSNEFLDSDASTLLRQTRFTQPALFSVEYSLAQLIMSWGIKPDRLVGHSIGEYVAACVAGVFTLENALKLVSERGRHMQSMPPGLMLSVPLPAAEMKVYLSDSIELGCVNSSALTVLTGPSPAIESLSATLQSKGINAKTIRTSHAFHSKMMEPILASFAHEVRKACPQSPEISILSNLTGKELTSEEAVDPIYWAQHLRNPVQFDSCLSEILASPHQVLLEVGPGRALATFARRHQSNQHQIVLTTMRSEFEKSADPALLLNSIGRCWLAGLEPDWEAMMGEGSRRVALPTYPFERQRIWPDAGQGSTEKAGIASDNSTLEQANIQTTAAGLPESHSEVLPNSRAEIDDWFYVPSWKRSAPLLATQTTRKSTAWLAFVNDCDFLNHVIDDLCAAGDRIIQVRPGDRFIANDDGSFALDPNNGDHYEKILDAFLGISVEQFRVLHGWTSGHWDHEISIASIEKALDLSMYSLMNLAGGLGDREKLPDVSIKIVSSEVQQVLGNELVRADKSALLGPCKIIPLEFARLSCQSIDVTVPVPDSVEESRLREQLIKELYNDSKDSIIALRGGCRWIESVAPTPIGQQVETSVKPRDGGTYLLTGGLGGIGLEIAKHLAETLEQPRLILLTRTPFPSRKTWDQWLTIHADNDPISRKIRKAMTLEADGADVFVKTADISDSNQMTELAAAITEEFGCSINGIINAAGVIDGSGTIQQRTRETHHDSIKSKVHGSIILERVFANAKLDFIVHCSSIATTLYHSRFAQSGYVVANGFLDALPNQPTSHVQRDTTPTVITINWDEWGSVGMAARAQAEFKAKHNLTANVFDRLDQCTPVEGVEVFRRALAAGHPRLIVSTRDLEKRIAMDPFSKSPFLMAIEKANESSVTEESETSSKNLERPTSIESSIEAVAAIWRQVTGIIEIDQHDNFFELGGSSLMATQVVARIRDVTGVEISVQFLFENPTVSKLARHVSNAIEEQKCVTDDSTNLDEAEEELLDGTL